MTKKDYEKFAKMFADLLAQTEPDKTAPVWNLISATAELFEQDNKLFSHTMFISRIRILYHDKDAK